MPSLVVDVGRLELALVNLLSNAIKYSDPAKDQRVVDVLAEGPVNGTCDIIVRDNGVGIPANRVADIFRRFTRAHTDNTALGNVSGIGLGLAIVDDCVRAMNGAIRVESTEGAGSVFVMRLPCEPGAEVTRDEPSLAN
jgi:signal transduction histidine kinase